MKEMKKEITEGRVQKGGLNVFPTTPRPSPPRGQGSKKIGSNLLEFSLAEKSHLLTLLRDAEERGEYYGNREQYWSRHDKIRSKLLSSKTK